MSVDPALSARVEAWLDTVGSTVDETEAAIAGLRQAGFAAEGIRIVVDDPDDASEAIELARAAGLDVLVDGGQDFEARLAQTQADTLFLVRWGVVRSDVIPSVVGFMDRNPGSPMVYADSASVQGVPLFRPVSSPLRLRSNDFLGPVVAVEVEALRRLGGFRAEARGAHVLDLGLRFSEQGDTPLLLPLALATEKVLNDDVAGVYDAQSRVVQDSLERVGVSGRIEQVDTFVRRVHYDIEGDPLVSIIIPTRGGSARIAGKDRVLVVEAIRGIVERSTYTNLEFVVVADAETPESVVTELEELCGDRLRLVLWSEAFNFSAKMNRGAAVASGEYLLLLNDDVEVVSDDWIESMLGLAQQRGVGIVGAMLYFEDSTIQHAGQVYTGGVAGHAAFGWTGGRDDSIKSLVTDHEVSGVTAACALLSRELYFEIGGFTLALPGNYNDVDLNMKVRSTGRSAVFTPWAKLYHFESKTRDPKVLPTDIETLQARWRRRMLVELHSRML